MRRAGSYLGLVLASVVLASCSTDVETPGEEPKPSASIVLFSATPQSVEKGHDVTIRWVVANALELSLSVDGEPLGEPILPGDSRLEEGRLTIQPEANVTILLEARGADEELVSRELAVEVFEKDTATIVEFRAEPAEIPTGQSATLFWRTQHAATIQIVDAGGEEVELLGARPEEGAVAVTPLVTTTYTLLAESAEGSAEATTTVTVLAAPTLSVSALPELIEVEESSTLSWTSEDAERVTIRSGEELVFETTEELSGEFLVSPSQTTVYTFEAFGVGGVTEVDQEVQVQPRVLSFTTDTVGQIGEGMLVDLRWTTAGATSLLLENPEGFSLVITGDDVAAGTRRAPVGVSGVFTLTARSGELEETETFTFSLIDQPVILDFQLVSGPLTAGPDTPAEAILRWDVIDARSLTLVAFPGGEVSLAGKSVDADEVVVSIYGPTRFVLTAENPNPAGPVSREVEAEVVAPPVIERFLALPSRIGQGESTEISWMVRDAERIQLERDGIRVEEVGPQDFSGTRSELLAADTNYTLRAFNSLDFEVVREFTVGIGAPVISSFTSNRQWHPVDGEIPLSWEAAGGTSLSLTGPGGATLHSTSDLEAIAEGSVSVRAPSAVGPATYTLTLENGAGSESANLTVEITDGPVIEHFEVSPELIVTGGSLRFDWRVTTDAFGTAPVLTLEDNLGASYDLGEANPLEGSASFTMTTPGSYQFTLEARSGETRFSTASVRAQVIQRPELISAQATPEYASNEGEPIVLEWQSLHADRLSLYAISDDGEVHGDAFFITTRDVAMGTTIFEPTLAAPHVRFVLESELGATVEEDLRVGIGPASILSFTAEPSEIFRGESATLSWEVARATSLEIRTPDYIETDEEYIDLSQRSTATQLVFAISQTVSHDYQFPGGFTFPFDGTLRRGVRVSNSGWLSFDRQRATGYTFKSPLPNPDRSHLHMTPYNAGEMNRGAHAGEIWTELFDADTDSPYLVIQYKNMSIDDITSAVLNYQIVLRHDGSFDFRYGSMSNPPDQAVADGSIAVIGYQNASGTKGVTVSRDTAYPGGLSYRTFHFPMIHRPVQVIATSEPFLDISGTPGAVEWTQTAENPQFFNSALVESFPEGFVFPFGGVDREGLWILRDGYVSFNLDGISSQTSRSTNLRMGEGYTVLDTPYVHLAPFWNYLVNNYGDSPGTIWTALREDAKGRFFVIQWKGFSSQAGVLHQNSDLNFQILLREDGSFEYRYGQMEEGSDPRNANGALSTIGFQEPNGVKGVTVSFNTPVLGGLTGKAWTFVPNPQLPLSGELEIHPKGDVEYTLVARNEHSYHEQTQRVSAHAHAALSLSTTPAEPAPQAPFTIDWHAAGITDLTIEDSEGSVVHRVQGSTFDLRRGSYPIAGLEMGNHRFTVRAQGFLGESIVEELEIAVFPPFFIDQFSATETRIRLGESTTLSWETTDVAGLSLESDITGPISIEGQGMNRGSLVVNPLQTTTYTLTATSEGRTKTATVVVEVRTISIEDFEVSGADAGHNVVNGAPVTVSWETQGDGGVYWFNETRNSGRPDEYFMQDVSAEAPFEDIEGTPGATQVSLSSNTSNADIVLPFFFGLYDDEKVAQARVLSVGLLSLTGSTPTTLTTNRRFPDPSESAPSFYASYRNARMGVFWDNLHPDGVGKVHTKHIFNPEGVDQFIIQWKGMRFHHSTAANRDGNLSFQIVLFEDQTFEFRYGKMSGTKNDEVPATEEIALRALGGTASIGFRSEGKEDDLSRDFLGQQVSFRTPAHNGGLSNRTLRFTRSTTPFPANGTVSIAPLHSTDYRMCATSSTWSECETFRVVVPQPGHLMITEIQVDPVGTDPVQWFEIRNLTLDPIDLEGMTLKIGSHSVPINTGKPLLLPPASYGVFSAATSTTFDSLLTYGTAIDLRNETSIQILSGEILMAEATWEPSWFAIRGTSLSLDTSMQRVGTVTTPGLAYWCESDLMYDEENAGTPGAHGSTCLSQHYDVDYLSDRPFIELRGGVGMRQPEMVGRFEHGQVPPGNGFTFPFFDQLIFVDEMWGGNFGVLSFAFWENVVASPVNIVDAQDLHRQTPSDNRRAGAAGMVASAWFEGAPRADLTTDFHSARLMVDGFEVLVVQWSRYSEFLAQYTDPDPQGHITHQIQIWENGDIVLAYEDIVGVFFNGSNASVGIVGPEGTPVLQYLFKEPLLTPYQSILYKKK